MPRFFVKAWLQKSRIPIVKKGERLSFMGSDENSFGESVAISSEINTPLNPISFLITLLIKQIILFN